MEQPTPTVPIVPKSKKASPLTWLTSILIVLVVIGAISLFYLYTQNSSSSTTTQNNNNDLIRTEVSGISTALTNLSSELDKEMTAIIEDQKSDEDTTPSGL
jgi:anionic cell wall polymer biosynthesis LytR-Cps2A-Psr (LCP) family protein